MTAPPMTTATAPPSAAREFWRYFCANRGALAGLIVFTLLVLAAILAPLIAPHPPNATRPDALLRPPGAAPYLLGTDAIGRDMLSRLLYGARLSLLIGASVVVLSFIVGVAIGLIAGFTR